MKLKVKFNEVEDFKVKFVHQECTFKPSFGEIFTIHTEDVYEGPYDVVPRVYEQILETKDKLMLNDVTVEIIPRSYVINQKNGYTVTIG